jgi:hypothetical protein
MAALTPSFAVAAAAGSVAGCSLFGRRLRVEAMTSTRSEMKDFEPSNPFKKNSRKITLRRPSPLDIDGGAGVGEQPVEADAAARRLRDRPG